jgi:hypothetical protein
MARNCPKELLAALNSISYQADRLMNIRDTEITEAILEKSMELLTAIVKFYSSCLEAFSHGLLGELSMQGYFC